MFASLQTIQSRPAEDLSLRWVGPAEKPVDLALDQAFLFVVLLLFHKPLDIDPVCWIDVLYQLSCRPEPFDPGQQPQGGNGDQNRASENVKRMIEKFDQTRTTDQTCQRRAKKRQQRPLVCKYRSCDCQLIGRMKVGLQNDSPLSSVFELLERIFVRAISKFELLVIIASTALFKGARLIQQLRHKNQEYSHSVCSGPPFAMENRGSAKML
jgi:hypothetical protein